MPRKLQVSHSMITSKQSCKRRFYYEYVLGMQTARVPVPFIIGRAMHAFIEKFYQGMPVEKAVNEPFDEALASGFLSPAEVETLEIDRARTHGAAIAYASHYASDLETYPKRIAEKLLRRRLVKSLTWYPEGLWYRGYLDMIVQDQNDDWWIFETKTASDIDDDYVTRTAIDWQISSYCWLIRYELGFWPKGVIYNVIKKTRIRRKQSETKLGFLDRVKREYLSKPEEYFLRWPVIVSRSQIKQWKEGVLEEGKEIARLLGTGETSWPQSTGQCKIGYARCPWLEACHSRTLEKEKLNKMLYKEKE